MSKFKIIYSAHLEFRLKIRNISRLLPKRIFQTSKEHYFDTETGKSVAVISVKYKGKVREIAVMYEQVDSQITLATIHP